jgi:hypothetical protein
MCGVILNCAQATAAAAEPLLARRSMQLFNIRTCIVCFSGDKTRSWVLRGRGTGKEVQQQHAAVAAAAAAAET